MQDVADRLSNRIHITTDGHKVYLDAVQNAFGGVAPWTYAQLVKIYGDAPKVEQRRYSPAHCTGTERKRVTGNPDPDHRSTSYAERQNLTMRMCMRRFTCLTNGFSKKLENHIHMLSLYFVHCNFCRIHKSLRVTPAMEAGLTDGMRDISWIIDLIDARSAEPKRPAKYKRKNQISN